MIFELLKKLAVALPRFVLYQIRWPFSPVAPRPSPPSPSQALPTFDHIADDIGLDSFYKHPVEWPTYRSELPIPELLSDPLYKQWSSTSGGQKWSHYFWIYRSVFETIRHQPSNVLEIGVLRGASLELWKKYFDYPESRIVGIDIDTECRQYDAPQNRIHVRIGSQADPDFLNGVIAEFGRFDLIIDDGSHISSHIIASFNHLFADGLKDDGIYFVEDLHANYWPGWRDTRKSFLDICKELLEHMNAHYQRAPHYAFLVRPSEQPLATLHVPRITAMIKEMRFYDSIVAIYKANLATVPHLLLS